MQWSLANPNSLGLGSIQISEILGLVKAIGLGLRIQIKAIRGPP
jgi:hypothetical protein